MSQSDIDLQRVRLEKTEKQRAKNPLTYYSQIIVIYAIIAVSVIHLSLQSPDKELWLVLLSSSLGYILPSPTLKFSKGARHEFLLPNSAE